MTLPTRLERACRECDHSKREHTARGRCLFDGCCCKRYAPKLTQEEIEKEKTEMLGRAYRLILSWPCRICGLPYPCECDVGNTLASESG